MLSWNPFLLFFLIVYFFKYLEKVRWPEDIDDDGNTDKNSKDDINNGVDAGHNNMGYN